MALPVLVNGGSLSALTGPTADYLLGFVLMAGVISSLAQRYQHSRFWARLGFAILGNVFLFVPGISFAHLFTWEVALKTGFLPFVLALPTKAALAVALSVYFRDT